VIAMYNGFGRICHLFLYLFMKREWSKEKGEGKGWITSHWLTND
jgi:hypothetical protein